MINFLIPGAILTGSILIALILWLRKGSAGRLAELDARVLELVQQKSQADITIEMQKENLEKLEALLEKERASSRELTTRLASVQTENSHLQERIVTHKAELEELQTKFTAAFENLANRIFEEKSQKFTQENRSRLDEILDPLRERIREFEQKVDSTNKEHLARSVSLIEQIHNLEKLNRQISEDAENLTKALKGDVKVRGNWGEVILERILEESGLQKGREYETQASFTEEDGSRKQLDVLLKLPEEKYLIIDSKLSLLDYERLVGAEEEAEQQQHLRKLLSSVRTHIDGLYRKHYHDLKEINTPDFVLLFMPIEGCFSVVVQNDQSLYQYALEKHIVIVSPSTLLITLRTIAFIWRQENQTRNAMEIARQSGNLYDAFVRLLEDLDKIGSGISKADQSYQEAVKRISTGRGNLVSRVENLRQLGAKASKNIPDNFQNEPAMIENEPEEQE